MNTDPSKAKGEQQQGLLLTLDRGLQVLEQIARDRGRATAKSLTASLDINLGTCYQVLRTLHANGYVQRSAGGRYGLGPRVGFLTEQYGSSLSAPPELDEILHELHDELGETVYISIRRDRELPIVGVLEGTRILRVGSMNVGYSGHPHIRASTKAYLAFTDEGSVEEFFDSRRFEPLTPNTITSWDQLMAELEATRRRGYGVDNEEYVEGVTCIGAVIVDDEGQPYGAYGTSFPASRLASDEAGIAALVVDAAERASRSMGYTGPYPPGPRHP